MNNLENEFIRAIMISLKIENNPFIVATVKDYVKHIKESQYKDFMSELFGTQHSFLNGLDRVSKVAEQFKPNDTSLDDKAKRIIAFTESLNTQIGEEAKAKGQDFVKMVKCVKLPPEYDRTMAVMNHVKPYCDAKELIINIRRYQTSIDAIIAFKRAIIYYENNESQTQAIESKKVSGLLRGVVK